MSSNSYESNTLATAISGQLSSGTDVDYYKYTVTSEGSLSINFNDTAPPSSEVSSFVERLYENVLGRNSDEGGLKHWIETLQTSNAADVAKSFFNSSEFLNHNYADSQFVQTAYLTFMDREYDQGGLDHWLNQLSSGLTRDGLLDSFARSGEFTNIAQSYGIDAYSDEATTQNPNLTSLESFVERFYTVALNRDSDSSGLDYWSAALENGTLSADDIAKGFFLSTEFTNKNLSNDDFIDTAYETFFNREADSGGKSHWLTQLNGGLSRDDMLDGFIYSDEFEILADSYGIEVGAIEVVQLPISDEPDSVDIDDLVGRYTLIEADAEINGMEIHLDGSDVTGSYLQIDENGYIYMHIEYAGMVDSSNGYITNLTDSIVTIYYDETDETYDINYEFNHPYLTTNMEYNDYDISYSETDYWVIA